MALSRPIICLVTDRRRLPNSSEDALVRLAAAAARGGVDLIQIRERDLDDRRLLALTQRIVSEVRGTNAIAVVNDRPDVAMAAGAGGVHLRTDSVGADRVRSISPEGFLIGRSVHTVSEAAAAAATGVDYLVMGTIYSTASKDHAGAFVGTAGLQAVCRSVSTPVLAIGGVTTDKVGDIAAAGAAGLAAIGLFSDALDSNRHGDLEAALHVLVADIRRAFTPPACG
jgi:thiamine-phosphate pyrophosphorylase